MIKIILINEDRAIFVRSPLLESEEIALFDSLVEQFNRNNLVSVKLDPEFHQEKQRAIPSKLIENIIRK